MPRYWGGEINASRMKPFNLEEYRAGATPITRCGIEVKHIEISDKERDKSRPIIYELHNGEKFAVSENGRRFHIDSSPYDLMLKL